MVKSYILVIDGGLNFHILDLVCMYKVICKSFGVQAADFDVEAAQRGIVYIDEVDKITKVVRSYII